MMDTKRLFLNITLTLALFLGYQLFLHYMYKLHPGWVQSTTAPVTSPGTNPAITPVVAPTTSLASVPATNPAVAANVPSGFTVLATTQPTAASIGADSAVYPMVLTVDPQGAGLKSVTLSDYFDTAAQKNIYKFEQPLTNFEAVTRPLATRTVTINGTPVDISNANWTEVVSSKSSATYATTITLAGKPVLELTKQFTLKPRDAKDDSKGFDVAVEQDFRNLSPATLNVSATINGPTAPTRESDLSEDRRYLAGYDDGDSHIVTSGPIVTDLKKDKPSVDLVASDKRPMLWVGACNSYFESLIRPDYVGQAGNPPIRIASAVAAAVDPGSIATDPTDLPTSLSIETTPFSLAPGAVAPLNLHVFFGPKKRELLENAYYSAFPLVYSQTLVYSSGMCGFLTFTWLITILSGILWFFHAIFRDWGLAIIGLVVMVKVLLHPIAKRAQVNMMSMSKMQPEMERLKKKYGDNKEELNKAMWEVTKKQGATPILGCLPMLLQTPIWIALWSALQSTFELRQAPFLRWGHVHLTWISDLAHPDALISFGGPLPIPFLTIKSLNILPLLLLVTFYIQQAMTPKPENMTPEQEQQRKMQKWMALIFPVMLYNRPSGLSLYILTSTTIGIVENKIIRDHIKERDAAEKADKIIVDAGPTRNSKQNKNDKLIIGGKQPAKKAGGLAGWIADLKAKAEEFQREAERRSKDRA
jgi:YidC/Oxa1 family membrane protein insertase